MKSPKKDSNSNKVAVNDLSNKFLGIRMAAIFVLAKLFKQMPLNEIEKLPDNDYYEVRMSSV